MWAVVLECIMKQIFPRRIEPSATELPKLTNSKIGTRRQCIIKSMPKITIASPFPLPAQEISGDPLEAKIRPTTW